MKFYIRFTFKIQNYSRHQSVSPLLPFFHRKTQKMLSECVEAANNCGGGVSSIKRNLEEKILQSEIVFFCLAFTLAISNKKKHFRHQRCEKQMSFTLFSHSWYLGCCWQLNWYLLKTLPFELNWI